MIPHILEFIDHYVLTLSALGKFAIILVMLIFLPRLSRRVHIPSPVGLLLGGVIVGPYVLGFATTDRPIVEKLLYGKSRKPMAVFRSSMLRRCRMSASRKLRAASASSSR